MGGGPSILRHPASEKSNIELINSLKSNFDASKQASAVPTNSASELPNGSHDSTGHNNSYRAWTTREGNTVYIPSVNFSQSGLIEERSEYDVTVKLFFLPGTPISQRRTHAQQAIDLVLKELRVPSVDLLIVSFPGVSFDADDEGDSESSEGSTNGEADDIDAMLETWRSIEALHSQGVALQVGVSEFGGERLQKFLPRTKIRPSVDQINVRDCCVVPKSLILYTKRENIELLTHNDCTNILPSGTVRELLGSGSKGGGIFAGSEGHEGLKGEIEPRWVVKYTAVVRDRGVIENKGYFAAAEVQE